MIGFLREVSPHLDRCELAASPRRPVKPERARKQHAAYIAALRELGVTVEYFSASPDQPAGVFVEDAAVLLPEVAVISRPTALSRAGEIETIAPVLAQYGPVQRLADQGQLEGGDVLRIGHTLYASASAQTNEEGIAGLREIVQAFDYDVRTVELHGGARLKTACTFIPPHFLLANPAHVNPAMFGNLVVIGVAENEPFAANTLTIGGTTLVSASFPETEKRLRAAGISTLALDISEFEKAQGGVTSLSLILEPRTAKPAAREVGIKTIQAPDVPAPAGHVSQAIVHGGLVFVSPQPPFDPADAPAGKMPIEEQTEQALRNVAGVLASAGSSLSRVLRVTIHLTDPKMLGRIEPVYARVFDGHRPTRGVVEDRALPAGASIAVEVVAAVSEGPP